MDLHVQYYQLQQMDMDTIAQYEYLYSQNQTNICNADPNATNHHQWCTFQAVDGGTAIVELIYFGVVLAICIIAIINYKKVRQLEKNARYRHMFGDAYFWMHSIIFGWIGCTLIRLVLNIFIYFRYMDQDSFSDDADPPITSLIVIVSSFYQLLDFACSFLINLLLILVVFQFIKNYIGSISESQIITFNTRVWLKRYLIFLNALRLYTKYVRNIVFVLVAIPEGALFYLSNLNLSEKCNKFVQINYYLISSETMLIIIFYMSVGAILILLYCKQLLKMQSEHVKKIFFYSFLLAASLIVRVIVNFIFTQMIFKQNYYVPDQNCKNTYQSQKISLTTLLVFHHLIMHLFPVCLILYIYRPTLSNYEMESLLDNKSQNSFVEEDISYKSISVNFYKDSIKEVPKIDENLKQPIQYT